jgi:hypothetical protein
MTAATRHGQEITRFLISTGATILILSPSLAAGMGLLGNNLPLQPALKISLAILLLASVNFGTAIMLDPYRRYFSKLAPPALVSMVAIVFSFIITESLKQFFQHLGYGLLTPFIVACLALIYTAILVEKNIPLKCLLSLDSIALMFLWALGASDKFTMPF